MNETKEVLIEQKVKQNITSRWKRRVNITANATNGTNGTNETMGGSNETEVNNNTINSETNDTIK